METLRRTSSGGVPGQLLIGCGGLIILGCLCAVSLGIFGILVASLGVMPSPASRLAEFVPDAPSSYQIG